MQGIKHSPQKWH